MSDKGHELTDKKLAELEKKLKAHYKQASDEVQKKLDDYLKAFKAKDARHLADLQKDFTKENYEEYIRWRQGQVLISERWEEMRQSLAEDYHNANVIARSIIDGYMPDIYALNHNYGTYDVEHSALVDTSYTLYDRQTVERLMRDDPDMLPPPGKKVSKRIAEGKDMLWNKSMIQSSMWQSITQGESMDKIAKRLAQTVGDKDMAAAVRNARTMTTGAECAGRVDSYKRAQSMGIHLQQEWMATLDGRTRHTHRQLHGERIDVGGTFPNGCRFPGDPHGPAEEVYNCRCTLVAAIKGFEGDKVTYSPKLGEQSFEEWQNEHEKGLDKSQESGIIKNIELTDITNATASGKISEEVSKAIFDTLSIDDSQRLFDSVKVINVDPKIVMQTDPVRKGSFFDTELNLNENFLGGKTVAQLDEEIKSSNVTVANSLKEAVIHEKYHAMLINGLNQAELESLYDELSEMHIVGVSPTAAKDGAECIAEIGVLYERGDTDWLPQKAIDLFNQHIGGIV